jgi:hypothetical protein
MGLVTFGLPHELIEFLAAEHKLGCFFESGSYYGESSAWAAQRFAEVTTVERAPILFSIARLKLGRFRNVRLELGDSRDVLRELLPSLPPTLFWLDAHWCGGQTAGQGDAECPLLDELRLIAPDLDRHFVLIDDARLFAMPPPPPNNAEAWPCLTEIVDALRSRHQPYIAICRDVIVAVPAHAKPGLISYFRSILPDEGTAVTGT